MNAAEKALVAIEAKGFLYEAQAIREELSAARDEIHEMGTELIQLRRRLEVVQESPDADAEVRLMPSFLEDITERGRLDHQIGLARHQCPPYRFEEWRQAWFLGWDEAAEVARRERMARFAKVFGGDC